MSCGGGGLLQVLKEQTRQQHEQVEGLLPLLRPGLAVGEYRRYLEVLYGLYAPLEALVGTRLGSAWPELLLAERRKLPLLAEDLRALGHDGGSLASLPSASRLPVLADRPEALGCLYVLEGATLGGQVLLRHLSRHFAGVDVGPYAFLRSYGEAVGARWRDFGRVLSRACSEPALAPRVVRGAGDTFDTFATWLREAGP